LNASDINFSKELNAGSYESLVWPITMSTVFSMSYFQQVMAYFQEEEKKIYWIIVDHSIIMLNSDFPGFETYRQWVIHWYWGGGGMVFTPHSTIFQLYRGCQFYWWKKLEYRKKTIALLQFTDKLFHTICTSCAGFELTTLVATGSHKSNYQAITTATAPRSQMSKIIN
jgi:hypothetical protein